jgi:hypothetical protein
MPPTPPLVREEDAAQFLSWLNKVLEVGAYQMDVATPFAPQIAPKGALVFNLGDKVLTIWKNRHDPQP